MYVIGKRSGGHKWQPQNLENHIDRNGSYDIYTCLGCGLKGKIYTHTTGVYISTTANEDQLRKCPYPYKEEDFSAMLRTKLKK